MEVKRINAAGVMSLDIPEMKKQAIVKRSIKVFEVHEGEDRLALAYVRGRPPIGVVSMIEYTDDIDEKLKPKIIEEVLEQASQRLGFVLHVTKDTYEFSDVIKLKKCKDVFDDPVNVYYKA